MTADDRNPVDSVADAVAYGLASEAYRHLSDAIRSLGKIYTSGDSNLFEARERLKEAERSLLAYLDAAIRTQDTLTQIGIKLTLLRSRREDRPPMLGGYRE